MAQKQKRIQKLLNRVQDFVQSKDFPPDGASNLDVWQIMTLSIFLDSAVSRGNDVSNEFIAVLEDLAKMVMKK